MFITSSNTSTAQWPNNYPVAFSGDTNASDTISITASAAFVAAMQQSTQPVEPITEPLLLAQTNSTAGFEAKQAEANWLNKQGIEYYITGRIPEALAAFEQALILFQEINDQESIAGSLKLNCNNPLPNKRKLFRIPLLQSEYTIFGDITTDGVIGLARAFMSSGVPSVIVSRWKVPNTQTTEIMTGFYQQLEQNPNKAQALRQAILDVKAYNLHNPYRWAGFVLLGEAE